MAPSVGRASLQTRDGPRRRPQTSLLRAYKYRILRYSTHDRTNAVCSCDASASGICVVWNRWLTWVLGYPSIAHRRMESSQWRWVRTRRSWSLCTGRVASVCGSVPRSNSSKLGSLMSRLYFTLLIMVVKCRDIASFNVISAKLRRTECIDQRESRQASHDARSLARSLARRCQLVVKQGNFM